MTENGYHIRHDLLMSMSHLNKQILMTYFIGSHTPWKLDPKDRALYTDLLSE